MERPKRPKSRRSDRFSNINALIYLSSGLPRKVQEDIADNLLAAIKNSQPRKHDDQLKSLGTINVLGLYKSKQKLRWYDSISPLHRAVSWMLTLPDQALYRLDRRCANLISYIHTLRNEAFYSPAHLSLKVTFYLNSRPLMEAREWGNQLVRRLNEYDP